MKWLGREGDPVQPPPETHEPEPHEPEPTEPEPKGTPEAPSGSAEVDSAPPPAEPREPEPREPEVREAEPTSTPDPPHGGNSEGDPVQPAAEAHEPEPTGRPEAPHRDWKNPGDYSFTEDLDPLGWAWQFLRRNASYRQQCEAYIRAAAERGEILPWFGPYLDLEGHFVLSDLGELPILDTEIEAPGTEILRTAFLSWLGEVRHLPEYDDYSPRTWVHRNLNRGWGRRPVVVTIRVFLDFDLAAQFAWIQDRILSHQASIVWGTRQRKVGVVGGRLKVPRLKWGISKSKNRTLFRHYLRALDGAAAGARPQQIAEELFSDHFKGLPPRPPRRSRANPVDRQAWTDKLLTLSQRVRDDLRTARQLSMEPWVILFSNPPRQSLRQRIQDRE
jgi:hypothetical protein